MKTKRLSQHVVVLVLHDRVLIEARPRVDPVAVGEPGPTVLFERSDLIDVFALVADAVFEDADDLVMEAAGGTECAYAGGYSPRRRPTTAIARPQMATARQAVSRRAVPGDRPVREG